LESPEGKIYFGGPPRRREDIVITDIREILREDMKLIHMAHFMD
jgi:hypothetical protein